MNRRKHERLHEAVSALLHNKITMVGLIILICIVIIAVFAPLIAPYGYAEMDLSLKLAKPSAAHWFGCDQFGRDVLSRLMYGSRNSLLIGLGSALMSLAGGVLFGSLSGYCGGWVDTVIMRIMDIILAFPSTVLAIALSVLLKSNLFTMMVIISVHKIPQFARITRGAILSVKERDFIECAYSMGQKPLDILIKHIWPNCVTPVLVYFSFTVAAAINNEASLSFLGIGLQSPLASWGTMLSDARAYILIDPIMAIFPGCCVTLTVLACNLLGDGIRDALDPKTRKG